MYYRGAQSAVLVYDMTSMTSFDSVSNWVTELHTALEDEICMLTCSSPFLITILLSQLGF